MNPKYLNCNMSKHASKTEFETRLRAWQKKHGFTAMQAAITLGVKMHTYNRWLHHGSMPESSPCLHCVEAAMEK
jgi:hypothetical protein